jgi:hypothetical protein
LTEVDKISYSSFSDDSFKFKIKSVYKSVYEQPKSVPDEKKAYSSVPKEGDRIITFESIKRRPLDIQGDNITIRIRGDNPHGSLPSHFDHTTWIPHVKKTIEHTRINAFTGETIDREFLEKFEKTIGRRIKL